MRQYLELVEKVLSEGKMKKNRTRIDTLSITGGLLEYEWRNNKFPLLTSKKMYYRAIFTELEFFIRGLNDKQWLKDRKCNIWNEWCNPKKIPYNNDPETLRAMEKENDLGLIYGVQWRNFDKREIEIKGSNESLVYNGVDQLKYVVNEIKNNPQSRRIICSAWNPNHLDQMALPPCHVLWQILINTEENTLDLVWFQRSCDLMLGIPFNLASYACLQYLLCLESGIYKPGKIVGFLSDLHIYKNHIDAAKLQLTRNTHELPEIVVEDFSTIFNWDSSKTKIINYVSEDKIKMEVAV